MSKKADRGPPSPEAATVALCLQIIDSFNADRVTPTTHADVFLAAQKNLAQDDEVFIRQVLFKRQQPRRAVSLTLLLGGTES